MPFASSASYAKANLGILEEKGVFEGDDYDSVSKLVDDPNSLNLDTAHAGFHSRTQEYLDSVQLVQKDATSDMNKIMEIISSDVSISGIKPSPFSFFSQFGTVEKAALTLRIHGCRIKVTFCISKSSKRCCLWSF
jgi:hypothetical protein